MSRVGVVIDVVEAGQALRHILAAEEDGVGAVWAISPRRGPDLLPIWAAASVLTKRIVLGTSILRMWTRHPVAFAFESLAVEQLAPGRFRLGIGPTSQQQAEHIFGASYDKPLEQLGEYLQAIRTLLHEGAVNFEGKYVVARTETGTPVQTPVLCSAAGLKAYQLAGRLSDGAISWVAPKRYLVEQAMPELARGAELAGRPRPPLVAHVPIVVNANTAQARALARQHLSHYAAYPHFGGMLSTAGFDPKDGLTDALLDQILVHGDEQAVAAGLRSWLDAGLDEVMAHPLADPKDPEGSVRAGFRAAAQAEPVAD